MVIRFLYLKDHSTDRVSIVRSLFDRWESPRFTVNSGRAHVYLSEKRFGADGYRSGLRGKCPIEIKIALGQAVEAGVVFSKSSMEGLMTSERIPSQFSVSMKVKATGCCETGPIATSSPAPGSLVMPVGQQELST